MREEFRWLPDGFSMRLRPGLLARRPAKIGDYMLTPFVGTEIFWDTRFNRVTNVRFTAGANLPVHEGFSVEPYYVRQFDPTPGGPTANIIGFLMLASF